MPRCGFDPLLLFSSILLLVIIPVLGSEEKYRQM